MQFCSLPGRVSLPSPTFFNYKDHIDGLCLEGKVGGRQLLSAQMMTQSLFVCSLARFSSLATSAFEGGAAVTRAIRHAVQHLAKPSG